jgi:hypothetical protein
VDYHQCDVCGSLQTDPPHWLEEAYAATGTGLDVGACQRCFDLTLDVSAMLPVLDFSRDRRCLDYGAGTGLFARFMRDRGYPFFAWDRYREPHYMDRFVGSLHPGPWSLITAFEVFEHLPNPGEELTELFRSAGDVLLCSTEFWKGQGLDWWYLVPDSGQHVFFYSEASFHLLAREHGFSFIDGGRLKLFLRNDYLKCSGLSARRIAAVVQDKEAFSRLRTRLLLDHQHDPYRWIQKDFSALTHGEECGEPTPAPPGRSVWQEIWRRVLLSV